MGDGLCVREHETLTAGDGLCVPKHETLKAGDGLCVRKHETLKANDSSPETRFAARHCLCKAIREQIAYGRNSDKFE